jgi:alkylhydroperoxidase/carboxymuconolactone decarboxylase family protein YurZ
MKGKLGRQFILYCSWKAMYDAARLAQAAGVEYRLVKEVIQTADPVGEAMFGLMAIRGDSLADLPEPTQQQLRKLHDLMIKDFEAARLLGETHDFPLPLANDMIAAAPGMFGLANGADKSPDPRDSCQVGLDMIDTIYGDGFSRNFANSTEPFLIDTTEHLFGEIWSRPGLSIRDRRLLSLGVLAAFGQADLIALHAAGALKSGDLDADQLHEAVLHLSYYAGGSNATMVRRGVADALSRHEADKAGSPDS